jgi:transposase InsO family protein
MVTPTYFNSLIEKSFRKIVKACGLGEFWRRVIKHYGKDVVQKLDEHKMSYIVRARGKGERASDIAMNLSVSRQSVEQVYFCYKKHLNIPALSRHGRRSAPISDYEVKTILSAHRKYKVGAVYLKQRIEHDSGIHINHDRIAKVLKMYGLSFNAPRRWIKKWVRFVRELSNTVWHVDWYQVKYKRWEGMWLIVYEDDASCFIVGYGLFKEATSHNVAEVLKEAITKYEKSRSMLSDREVHFCTVESEAREKGLTEFEVFLMRNHIKHILRRFSHSQTNAKVEKLR